MPSDEDIFTSSQGLWQTTFDLDFHKLRALHQMRTPIEWGLRISVGFLQFGGVQMEMAIDLLVAWTKLAYH